MRSSIRTFLLLMYSKKRKKEQLCYLSLVVHIQNTYKYLLSKEQLNITSPCQIGLPMKPKAQPHEDWSSDLTFCFLSRPQNLFSVNFVKYLCAKDLLPPWLKWARIVVILAIGLKCLHDGVWYGIIYLNYWKSWVKLSRPTILPYLIESYYW